MRAPISVSCCLLLLLPSVAAAGEGEEQVRLSLARYAELMAAAQRASQARPSWSHGTLAVKLPGRDQLHARVELSAGLAVIGKGDVPLLPLGVVLDEAQFDGNEAALVRVAGTHALHVAAADQEGEASLSYRVPVRTTAGGARHVVVPLPPLPGAGLTVDAGDAADEVEVSPAADVTRAGGRVTAALGATEAVVIRWGDGAKGHAVRRVDYRLSLDASGAGVDVEATYEVHGLPARARVRLVPTSAALMDVREGNRPLSARVADGWHVAEVAGRGSKTLRARFRLSIDRSHGQPQVTFHPNGVPITRLEANIPGSREVTLEPKAPVATTVRGAGRGAATRAVAHLPPSEQFTVRWTESRAAPEQLVRINTETFQLVTLQEGVLRSRVIARYEVIRGKVKVLSLGIPDDVVPYKVTGDGIEDWSTFSAADNQPRRVRIQLGREIEGDAVVELLLEKVTPRAEGSAVTVPIVRPLGAFREMGVVALFDGKKVGFAAASASGFSRTGEDALPAEIRKELKDKVRQAFKHVGPPGTLTSKVTAAEKRETRFDASVDTLFLVKEGSLLGSATVLVDVKSGRREEVVLSLPEGVTEPRITAPSLNKAELAKDFDAGAGRKAYAVRFTQALEGAVSIDVEYELLLPKELGRIQIPDVQVEGAEVENGSLGIAAETGIEVQPLESTELRRITVAELPRAVRLRSEREVLLGFTYAHPPWALAIEVERHRTVETLKGMVVQAWLETSVLDNGHLISQATYQVANEDRQYLRLALPEAARVLTVGADGRAVKAVADDTGAIAVPLPKGRTLHVQVSYEVTRGRLGPVGRIALLAPHADLRVGKLQWLLRVPADTALAAVETELDREDGTLYRAPALPVDNEAMPETRPEGEFSEHLFTYAVHDQSEPPLALSFVFVGAGTGALGFLLLIVALAALAVVVRRRAADETMRPQDWALLVVGVALLLAKAVAWGLGGLDALLALAVLVVVAVRARGTDVEEEVE